MQKERFDFNASKERISFVIFDFLVFGTCQLIRKLIQDDLVKVTKSTGIDVQTISKFHNNFNTLHEAHEFVKYHVIYYWTDKYEE